MLKKRTASANQFNIIMQLSQIFELCPSDVGAIAFIKTSINKCGVARKAVRLKSSNIYCWQVYKCILSVLNNFRAIDIRSKRLCAYLHLIS